MANPPKKTFSDDYPIPELRGATRLKPGNVRRRMAARAVYLEQKLRTFGTPSKGSDIMREELAALAQMIETYEERYPPASKNAVEPESSET